ncbi:DUF1508 domain-containing protein [Aggregatimonas sangjinii]|uniref:DUF1508 domain-containing protein n=1 Tax=Aggregatimonas sangjinii TaxID=2583587 RepID=A0A5B7SNC5_9FLAO|nr:YegP family protein [Aggregatimonas sangjinii]QCX00155.1 DUF1508 domain-containing protein [Aggregatimonas sangjinii]
MVEIKAETNDTFRFELRSADGIILLQSVPYPSKEHIKRTINALNPAVYKSLFFERKTDYEGKFLFHLKNAERELIGKSGVFESEAGMENGIKHLKKRIADLPADLTAL